MPSSTTASQCPNIDKGSDGRRDDILRQPGPRLSSSSSLLYDSHPACLRSLPGIYFLVTQRVCFHEQNEERTLTYTNEERLEFGNVGFKKAKRLAGLKINNSRAGYTCLTEFTSPVCSPSLAALRGTCKPLKPMLHSLYSSHFPCFPISKFPSLQASIHFPVAFLCCLPI